MKTNSTIFATISAIAFPFILAIIFAVAMPLLVQAQCMTLSFQPTNFNGANISCYGANDGAVFVNAIGPSRYMSYQWSNGQTDAQAQNMSAGTYTVTVTDNTGCVATGSVTLNEPAPMTFTTSTVSNSYGFNLKCNGDANGRITSEAFGGTGKILYSWSNGNQTAFATGLSAGTYNITATDDNGCIAVNTVSLTQPSAVTATAVVLAHPSVYGAADAEALATGNGGCGNYSFEWSNGEMGNELFNVAAGTYNVKVLDAFNCSSRATVTIVNPLNNTINGSQTTTNNGSRGSASNILRP